MTHERFDEQDSDQVNGVARRGSAVVGAGMVLPPGSPAERLYGDGADPAEWATPPTEPETDALNAPEET